jgi:hypothetical protein
MRCVALAVLAVILAEPSIGKPALSWKQEAHLILESGPTLEGADPEGPNYAYFESYVYRSVYGPMFYYSLVDHGGRVSLSFVGSRLDERFSGEQTELNTLQMMNSPFDWGGVMVEGQFKPHYAIKRIYDPDFAYETDAPDQSKSGLLIWRLPIDGAAGQCALGVAKTNEQAREIAEKHFINPVCQ